MRQEIPQERSQPVAVSPPEVRTPPALAGKRLLAILGIAFVILLLAATHPSFTKAAWAKFESAFQSKSAPLPASPAKLTSSAPELPTPGPSVIARQRTSLSADEQTQNLWAEFEKSAWGVSLQDWSSLHSDVPCKPFRGANWGQGADAQWAHRCSTGTQPEAAHWSFYAFGLQEPFVPRLEQFDGTTAALPEDKLASVQNLLQTRLAARYGPGEDLSPKIARARAVPWPTNVRWQAADFELQLHLSEFDPQRKVGRLRLLGRHRALLDALNEDERLKPLATNGFLYEVGSGMDARLADNLRADFPDMAAMLMKQRPDPDPQKMREAVQQLQNQLKSAQSSGQTGVRAAVIAVPQTSWKPELFHDALVRLLTSAKTSPPDRQPVLLLAADRLAWRLPGVMDNDKSQAARWPEWRTQLADLGVNYEPAFSAPPEYSGNLLKRVWTDFPESDWGERAFLLLLSHGWDTGVDCAAGSDQFRTVIQQGLQFQEQHPKSSYLLDVRLAVAQAYETWWSLSQVPTAAEYAAEYGEEFAEKYSDANPAEYQEGAEAARQKSIAYYEQLLQAAPQSDHAAYSRRVLPRLKLGSDTGQRRFYCSVGD